MSPEQQQEWLDDEEALRRETTEAHAPAPESTESDERAARVERYARAIQSRRVVAPALRDWYREIARAAIALADSELAEAKREIARLRAGESEDDAPVNVVPTPGQWVKRFNDASADERLAAAERAIANADTVQGHFMRNTNGELIRLRSRAERAEREIAALHRDALAEAQAYRAMFAENERLREAADVHWEARTLECPECGSGEEGCCVCSQMKRAEAAESKLAAVEALRARYEERAENGCPVGLNYARAHRDLTTALGGGE